MSCVPPTLLCASSQGPSPAPWLMSGTRPPQGQGHTTACGDSRPATATQCWANCCKQAPRRLWSPPAPLGCNPKLRGDGDAWAAKTRTAHHTAPRPQWDTRTTGLSASSLTVLAQLSSWFRASQPGAVPKSLVPGHRGDLRFPSATPFFRHKNNADQQRQRGH